MIVTAIQKSSRVYVYDEKRHILFTCIGELQGYTGSSVSVRKGHTIVVYDEKGHVLHVHPCPG
ncbi:MAG: hypothetical protein HUK26_08145 [Duodenibacillus sp.]|nr:hypothetical protein [Duodenibacillus sp.]